MPIGYERRLTVIIQLLIKLYLNKNLFSLYYKYDCHSVNGSVVVPGEICGVIFSKKMPLTFPKCFIIKNDQWRKKKTVTCISETHLAALRKIIFAQSANLFYLKIILYLFFPFFSGFLLNNLDVFNFHNFCCPYSISLSSIASIT